MKKNGFTLVELLAVVAVLAILIAITLPNILKEYKKVKTETFVVDVQTVMDVAKSKFTSDSLNNDGQTVYYSSKKIDGLETKKLDIDMGKKDYFIEMDRKGNFKRVIVYNKEYCYDIHSNFGNESIGIIDGVKSKQFNNEIKKTDIIASDVWLSGNDMMLPEVITSEDGRKYYNIKGCEGTQKVDLGKDNKNDIIVNGKPAEDKDIDYELIGLNEFNVKLETVNGKILVDNEELNVSIKEKIKYGTTVSWLVSPDESYLLDGATITGGCVLNGNRVSITVNGETNCVLNMQPAYECKEGTLVYDEIKGAICTMKKPNTVTQSYQCNCYSYCSQFCPRYEYRTENYTCYKEECIKWDPETSLCIESDTIPQTCTRRITVQVGTYCCNYGYRCNTCYTRNYGSCLNSSWESLNETTCYKEATKIEKNN